MRNSKNQRAPVPEIRNRSGFASEFHARITKEAHRPQNEVEQKVRQSF